MGNTAKGHDVNKTDKNCGKKAPIHFAIFENKPEVVKLLVDSGANVNIKEKFGFTPLHISAGEGLTKVTQILLENGAEVDVKVSDGETPIGHAAMYGHTEDADLLIKYGANGKYHLRPKANLDVEKS